MATFFCVKCGADADPDDLFCRKCGNPLSGAASSSSRVDDEPLYGSGEMDGFDVVERDAEPTTAFAASQVTPVVAAPATAKLESVYANDDEPPMRQQSSWAQTGGRWSANDYADEPVFNTSPRMGDTSIMDPLPSSGGAMAQSALPKRFEVPDEKPSSKGWILVALIGVALLVLAGLMLANRLTAPTETEAPNIQVTGVPETTSPTTTDPTAATTTNPSATTTTTTPSATTPTTTTPTTTTPQTTQPTLDDAATYQELSSVYDSIGDLVEGLSGDSGVVEEFNATYLSSSLSERQATQTQIKDLLGKVEDAQKKLSDLNLPADSPYASQAADLATLLNDLNKRVAVLDEAIAVSIAADDPADVEDDIHEIIARDQEDGVNKYKTEFDELYPEAKPSEVAAS